MKSNVESVNVGSKGYLEEREKATTKTKTAKPKLTRQDKAAALVSRIIKKEPDGIYLVPSESYKDRDYEVQVLSGDNFVCTCADFLYRGGIAAGCKHIHAVKLFRVTSRRREPYDCNKAV